MIKHIDECAVGLLALAVAACNGSSGTTGAGGGGTTKGTSSTTSTATGGTTSGAGTTTAAGTTSSAGTTTGAGTSGSTGSGAGCKVGTTACTSCLNMSCSTQLAACDSDPTCKAGGKTVSMCICNAQMMSSMQKAAQNMCVSQFSGTGAPEMALATCLQGSCSNECLLN